MENLEEEIKTALEESRAARKEGVDLLILNGEEIDFDKWLTVKEYVKRYNLKSLNIVTNWIPRGIIPPENVRIIPELNGLRLVKAIPYKAIP